MILGGRRGVGLVVKGGGGDDSRGWHATGALGGLRVILRVVVDDFEIGAFCYILS